MTIEVGMPSGGDERIEPKSIFVLREPIDYEREESPAVQSCIWGAGYRIYSIETLPDLLKKTSEIKFARLTAPAGATLLVNAQNVVDWDQRSAVRDHPNTNSVLCFGTGALSPRVRVREHPSDLKIIWQKLGLSTDVFD